MKRFAKILSVLFTAILAISVFAFAAETEVEKTYIVYPKEEIALFSSDENAPEYMVIGEEELDMLLEEAPEMIDWYEENIEGELFWNTYDEAYTEEHGYVRYELDVINAAPAWEKGYYGDKIRIAVIDSGLCEVYVQTEFSNVISGKDYTSSKTTNDTFGHGTQVTGMIAAAHNGVLVKGISPCVEIVPLKVTNDGKVYTVEVSQAIRDAVDEYKCDVINLSLGFPSSNETLKSAVDYAVGKGVTVVAAVGNYKNANPENKEYQASEYMETVGVELIKSDSLEYPAAYDNVIGVGSVHRLYGFEEKAERVSPISKQNSSVLITAPGERVITTHLPFYVTDNDGNQVQQFCYYSYGTSLSAPLVSGAVALLKQANPDLTPAEIMNILAESARDDAKGDGYDTAYGHGILNVAAAIELALGYEMLAPDTVTYTVSAENSELNGAVTVENYIPGNIGSHPLGTSFTAKAEPTVKIGNNTYKFAYWANGNGTHISGNATYTFNATSNFTLRAVYDKGTDNESATTEKKVEFWNGNGVLLGTQTANDEGKISSAEIPVADAKMTGYEFDGWLDEEKNAFTADSILEKNLTRVVAQFKDNETTYSITFDNAAGTDKKETGTYGEKVTYTATEGFDYWKLGNKIVSYDKKIEIALWGADKKLVAVYDDDTAVAKPTVVLDTGADGADFLIYAVPKDYKIVDAGIVFGKSGENPRVASFRSKASVKELPGSGFGQFTSLPGDASHVVARGYLIYKEQESGIIRVIYSD